MIKEIYRKMLKYIDKDAIYLSEPMSKHTSFKVGGIADIFICATTEEQVKDVLKLVKQENIPLFILGNGSNLIVKDGGIRGIVLKIALEDCKIIQNEIHASSGLLLSKLSNIALDNELTGLEFASGIPGTLGGAIKMNAGAYSGEMKDIVASTRYINLEGNVFEILNNDHKFGYRDSIFKNKNYIILSSIIKLQKGEKESIKNRITELTKSRTSKQPLSYPSAGSVFKRPEGDFAARLIEDSGLKGFSIGGAQVSDLHAGFIINKGNATTQDILQLIEYIKNAVYEKSKVKLETEVIVVGED